MHMQTEVETLWFVTCRLVTEDDIFFQLMKDYYQVICLPFKDWMINGLL